MRNNATMPQSQIIKLVPMSNMAVPRDKSSRGMRTSLVVSRGTYECILKFRLKLYKPFSLKLQYRTKKMLKKHICCCYC